MAKKEQSLFSINYASPINCFITAVAALKLIARRVDSVIAVCVMVYKVGDCLYLVANWIKENI